MPPHDDEIDKLIADEEAALLSQIDSEPGYFAQLGSAFQGRTGWVNMVLMTAQTLLFLAGSYATWQFFEAGDMLAALRWGLPGATLLLMALIVKLALWPAIQTNRILRAMKRLELALMDKSA